MRRTRWLLAMSVLAVAVGASSAAAASQASGPASKYEKQFLIDMISHHGMAVEMATMAKERATHAQLKRVANSIIRSQSAEIKQMQGWLKQWYGVRAGPTMSMEMHAQMNELERARGAAFEVRFLALMSVHHTQAIERANLARQQAPHAQVRRLAARIVAAQNREVNEFRNWLAAWYAK